MVLATVNSMFNAFPPWYLWFDGVAGAAVLAVGGFIVRRFWFRSDKAVEVHQAVRSETITDSQVAAGSNITQTSVVHHHYSPDKPETELIVTQPDPLKVFQTLNDLSPYDSSHAREKFVGLPVIWRITLDDVSKAPYDKWGVTGTFRVPSIRRRVSVSFDLSSLPPELKVAERDTPIWVRGIIKRVAFQSLILLEDDPELLRLEHS